MKRFPIFYAPDGTDTGSTAVAAADSPTGTAMEVTPRREMPAAEIIQPAPVKTEPRIRQPGVKISKVDVAKELGLDEAPSVTIEREAAKKRDEHGRFVKTPKDWGKPPEKKEEPVELGEPTPKAEEKPEPVVSETTPAKIKLGEEEKTAEEWQAHFKALKEQHEKEASDALNTEVKVEPKPEEVAQKTAAAQKQLRDAWEAKTREAYVKFMPDQKALDKALADGDPKALFEMFTLKPLLAMEENMRLWVQNSVNPLFEQLSGQLTPLASTQEQIAAYQAESQFLDQHPDIKAHKDGVETIRGLSAELHAEYDDLQQFIAGRPTSPNAPKWQARVKELESSFHAVLAKEAKARLGTPAPVVKAPVAAPVAKPRPPAPTGNVGSAGSPKKISSASAEIAELEARGYM